jgi:hypothetical protein
MPFITDCLQLDAYTTTELDNMTNIVAGTIAYNSTLNVPVFYDGTVWKAITLT